jgi:hypothetical protein
MAETLLRQGQSRSGLGLHSSTARPRRPPSALADGAALDEPTASTEKASSSYPVPTFLTFFCGDIP